MNKITKIAKSAAYEAGLMAKEHFYKFDRKKVEMKAHNEYVTKVDGMSEEIIIKHILQTFPDHHILSEESGDNRKQSDYTWVIDPIDGTTNFTMHNPFWGISIGVAYKNEVVVGVVYAPMVDELYIAEKGQGAWLNGKRIGVSKYYQGKTLNAFCNNRASKHVRRALKYFAAMKKAEQGCYQYGSAALELGYVAAGRMESMAVPGAYAWDVAAGVILVREAGGRVTDFKGRQWNLGSDDMLASNGKVHNGLLEVVKKL